MYYLLKRGDTEFQIILDNYDGDPVYGMGSWDMYAGPFTTWQKAEDFRVARVRWIEARDLGKTWIEGGDG